MNKDRIAVYLNEHPEFFNDYPELLRKIKAIDEADLPLEPQGTVSLTERIIQRAHQDQEHLKTKLEWLVEISQANATIQEHLFEIERSILSSANLEQLVGQLKEEIAGRFAIPHVRVFLADETNEFLEIRGTENPGPGRDGALGFVDRHTLDGWFEGAADPVLRGEVNGDSERFEAPDPRGAVKSEALIPIQVRGRLAGGIALGSEKPFHFHPGLRTDFLARMAEKMAIAIDNILLIDRLRRQPVIDKQTGLYNRAYLDPVLAREFDLARRRGKSLSCVKLHVDTLDKLLDTYGETAGETVLSRIGTMLTANCRSCDILVRTDIGEFVALLPEIDAPGAEHVARRIRGALETLRFPEFQGLETPAFSIGVATDPGDGIETHRDLLLAAGRNLNHDRRLTTRRAV